MKAELSVLFGGANAGGTYMARMLADANARARSVEFSLHVADPNSEHLDRIAAIGAERGLRTRTEQRPIETVLATRDDAAPVGIFIDDPSSIAAALDAAARTARPTLLSVALLLATGELFGLRAVVTAAQRPWFEDIAALFRALALSTVPSGAGAVFGEGASPEHIALEPHIRRWFARHMLANLLKVTSGLRPESAPIEVTRDGTATMPVFIQRSATWGDPLTLAQQFLTRPPIPVLPGTDVVIAEIGAEQDIRLHEARLRCTDRQIALRNASVPLPNRDEREWPSLAAAMQRIAQNAIAPGFPVRVTD